MQPSAFRPVSRNSSHVRSKFPIVHFQQVSWTGQGIEQNHAYTQRRSTDSFPGIVRLFRRIETRMTTAATSRQGHPETSMDLALLGNRALQVAVRQNLVC